MAESIQLLTKDYSIIYDEVTKKLFIDRKEITHNPIDPSEEFTEEDKIKLRDESKRKYYKKKLEKQYENLVIISGAGTSIDVGQDVHKGKSMTQLWELIDQNDGVKLKEFCESISFPYESKKNIESLLSYAKRALDFSDKFPGIEIHKKIKEIETIIKSECSLQLPSNSPHEIILNKLSKRKLKYPRLKVFTLNYDTLFEQAAAESGFMLIDGFSYSYPRTFSGRNFKMDFILRENSRINPEENYLTKVCHIYKMHGSINWSRNNSKVIIDDLTNDPLLIYPNDSKFEQSFEQPFFEMMARFQTEIRKENVLAVCIGFSFNDKHITTVIKEAISQNPSFELMVVDKRIQDGGDWEWIKEKAKLDSRLCLVSECFNEFSINFPEINTRTKEDIVEDIYD